MGRPVIGFEAKMMKRSPGDISVSHCAGPTPNLRQWLQHPRPASHSDVAGGECSELRPGSSGTDPTSEAHDVNGCEAATASDLGGARCHKRWGFHNRSEVESVGEKSFW